MKVQISFESASASADSHAPHGSMGGCTQVREAEKTLQEPESAPAEQLHGDRRRPDEDRQKYSQYHDGRERHRSFSFLFLGAEDSVQRSVEAHGFRAAEAL